MPKKFTDEELSRILGESAAGHMLSGGGYLWRRNESFADGPRACCVNQAAYNVVELHTAFVQNREAGGRFDELKPSVMNDPEKLLRELEAVGVA